MAARTFMELQAFHRDYIRPRIVMERPDTAQAADVIAAEQPTSSKIAAPGAALSANQTLVLGLAAHHRLPAVYSAYEMVKDGGLASYGVDGPDLFRRAASYVDRILKGEKPGELPVQFATKFQLTINLKTAKALGLDPPIQLLARTDEVIE